MAFPPPAPPGPVLALDDALTVPSKAPVPWLGRPGPWWFWSLQAARSKANKRANPKRCEWMLGFGEGMVGMAGLVGAGGAKGLVERARPRYGRMLLIY